MTERNRNALTGLFALVGLLCFTVLVVLFGESQGLFQRAYVIRARFGIERTPNLRTGTEVYVAGVYAGNVGDIKLLDVTEPSKGLIAEMWVDNKFNIPKGSVARAEVPLMGQSIVVIKPPTEHAQALESLPRDGTAEIRGTVAGPMDSVFDPKMMASVDKTMQQVGDLAAALTPAANAVTDLLQRRTIEQVESPDAKIKGMTANLTTAIQRLYNVLTHFDKVLGDPAVQSNVKLTLENFRQASEGVKLAVADLQQFSTQAKEVAGAARGTLAKVDDTVTITRNHVDTLGRKLTTDADKLSKLLDYFVSVGQSLTEGKGTAAMFLNDPKVYDELLLTLRRLGEAASEMQTLIKQWQASGIGVKVR
jgi:ABC-type transporter Mla subunit MlaD